ncbi:AraC family transcriptional regulator [Pseudomonas sp. 3A(2025)]
MSETDVYVAGSLSGLLLGYLDEHALQAPQLRAELSRLLKLERLPMEVWWRLLDKVYQEQPREALGLEIGFMIRPHHAGVLGYLAMSCQTVLQALMLFQRYQVILHNQTPMIVRQEAGGLNVSWDSAYGLSTQASDEVLVASLLALARSLTGRADVQFNGVRFTNSASDDYARVCEKWLGCPVSFEQSAVSIVIPLSVLALPINTHDTYLMRLMEQRAESMARVLPQPDEILSSLKTAIVLALQEGEPKFERICQKMGISSRSVYRHLQERGMTFKAILNQIRLNLALDYLANPNLQLREIAQLLGYAEQSAFSRAFKSWHQVTPLRYRQHAAKTRFISE